MGGFHISGLIDSTDNFDQKTIETSLKIVGSKEAKAIKLAAKAWLTVRDPLPHLFERLDAACKAGTQAGRHQAGRHAGGPKNGTPSPSSHLRFPIASPGSSRVGAFLRKRGGMPV